MGLQHVVVLSDRNASDSGKKNREASRKWGSGHRRKAVFTKVVKQSEK